MIKYFGYGSNMDETALKAKGVSPKRSVPAILPEWRLRFNMAHFFRHEGGVGNIEHTGAGDDAVHGMLHWCSDSDLAALDKLEARGIGYDRIRVEVETPDGPEQTYTYVGLPAYVDESCLPTRRYLNILVRGARQAGLDQTYVAGLAAHPVQAFPEFPRFEAPVSKRCFDHNSLVAPLTAFAGATFDMSGARPAHIIAKDWFGGKDVTVFLLRRMDSSDGSEKLSDVVEARLRPDQQIYINAYLHAFSDEYEYVGPFDYRAIPSGKQLA